MCVYEILVGNPDEERPRWKDNIKIVLGISSPRMTTICAINTQCYSTMLNDILRTWSKKKEQDTGSDRTAQ